MDEVAQQTIRELFDSQVTDTRLVSEFRLFDRSVSQKLWSTEYYYSELLRLDIHRFWVIPPTSDTQSTSGSITGQGPLLDIEGYCRHLNLLLDGFFMNSMSTLDTLAHHIATLYYFQRRPKHIYIVSIKNMLVRFHPNSRAGRFLDKQLSQHWFGTFEPFRHCTTHESLIRYDDITITFTQETNRVKISKIKLPDDPQLRPFTYYLNREAIPYCRSILRKIQWLVAKVYQNVLLDIRRNNNTLPMPPS